MSKSETGRGLLACALDFAKAADVRANNAQQGKGYIPPCRRAVFLLACLVAVFGRSNPGENNKANLMRYLTKVREKERSQPNVITRRKRLTVLALLYKKKSEKIRNC